jgi:hypothetical protein
MEPQPVPAPRELETGRMSTLQSWLANASTWVTENSTDVVVIGVAVAAILLLGGNRR